MTEESSAVYQGEGLRGFEPSQLLTAADVAQLLRIHPKRVFDLPIPQVRPSAARVRWLAADVDAFIANKRDGTVPGSAA